MNEDAKYVLDSFALLALIGKESGWQRVHSLLQSASAGKSELYISRINLAEVQYSIIRRNKDVSQLLAALQALPVTTISADESVPQVVQLKAHYSVALGDCFAAAIALDKSCPVVTGDPEFRKLHSVIGVEWL